MRKTQRSVRLSKEAQKILGRKVVRLTLNPVLLALSHEHVDWGGRERESGKLRPSDIALKARERFPDLPLSWAVEGCLALLIAGDKGLLKPLTVAPYSMLPESVRRFKTLSPAEKIRVGERWKRELRVLRGSR